MACKTFPCARDGKMLEEHPELSFSQTSLTCLFMLGRKVGCPLAVDLLRPFFRQPQTKKKEEEKTKREEKIS